MMKFDPRLTPARPDLAAAHLRGLVEAEAYVEGRRMRVSAGTVAVRHAPQPDASLDTEALFGQEVTLYEDHEEYGWVQLADDGYVGYMPMEALSDELRSPDHRVRVNRSFVYPGPDLKLPPYDALPMGARMSVQAIEGSYAKLDDAAYVFADHLAGIGDKESNFVTVAERFLHAPYLWGGKTSFGVDCSGLVQISLDAAGIKAPRDTDMQEEALGRPIAFGGKLAGLRRGDLVFWRGHVGIMQDATMLLHANAHHMLVVSEPLRSVRDRVFAKTSQQITAIKRLEGAAV
jgi:cell wall-associated NlpC family hydrolase